ncbi:MAG: hypothetical protein QMD88_07650 [Coprothermobacterota bacterium]|nr:hypothetical protein [Coprothermobacterota bacterium]
MGRVLWKAVSVFLVLAILLTLATPVMAKQQIAVPSKVSPDYLEPLIWHLDYPLNYLTLYSGAQGLGGEFTYSGSNGVNYGVTVTVYWSLFAPPPGATLGPILVKINYRGSTAAVLTKTFYGDTGSFTWYPELNRPFQVWITNLGSYNINAWGTVSMWFD